MGRSPPGILIFQGFTGFADAVFSFLDRVSKSDYSTGQSHCQHFFQKFFQKFCIFFLPLYLVFSRLFSYQISRTSFAVRKPAGQPQAFKSSFDRPLILSKTFQILLHLLQILKNSGRDLPRFLVRLPEIRHHDRRTACPMRGNQSVPGILQRIAFTGRRPEPPACRKIDIRLRL